MAVLLWPYLPASAERLLDALGAPDRLARRRALSSAQGGHRARGSARVAVPEVRVSAAGPVIDSHTHLDLCEPPDAELVGGRRRGRA